MKKLFVLGFPSLYGGAGTELHHQILCWVKMGNIKVEIIPTSQGYEREPLFKEMVDLGVTIHRAKDYSVVKEGDAVISFCCDVFLNDIDLILQRTKKTVFVNCMTWIFDKERLAHKENKIFMSLYQRDGVRDDHKSKLSKECMYETFIPYFMADKFPFIENRNNDRFTIGRISRQDTDKFSSNTFHIWEYAVAQKFKRGIVLGWDERSRTKAGTPPSWVETYVDQTKLPVNEFYKQCDIIVQSTDTLENLPRIGFEAMYSGCPLVVDNRGGWTHLIEHGESGFLCSHEREFIYWTSRLGFEPDLVKKVALQARERAIELSSFEKSKESWSKIFKKLYA